MGLGLQARAGFWCARVGWAGRGCVQSTSCKACSFALTGLEGTTRESAVCGCTYMRAWRGEPFAVREMEPSGAEAGCGSWGKAVLLHQLLLHEAREKSWHSDSSAQATGIAVVAGVDGRQQHTTQGSGADRAGKAAGPSLRHGDWSAAARYALITVWRGQACASWPAWGPAARENRAAAALAQGLGQDLVSGCCC